MALVRLAFKNLQQRAVVGAVTVAPPSSTDVINTAQKQRILVSQFLRRLSSAAQEKPETAVEVAVAEGSKKSKLFPRKKSRRGVWRRNNREFVPSLWELFPSRLGNYIMQATENMNKLMENLSPSQFMGRVKEEDDCYKLRYYMPGLGKEEVKITVEDGVLSIKGEHKEEKEEEENSDDEHWSYSKSYGYYNTSVLLPEDSRIDEIKAEMKDGVLNIVVPRTERVSKDVKEIQVN